VAYTLSNALQRAYTKLGMMNVGIATGGSITSAIVGAKANDGDKDNVWRNGVLFVIRSTDGAAPEGQYRRISAYAASSGTFTIDTAVSDVDTGDIVGWADDTYPFMLLVEIANQVIKTIKIGLTYTDIVTAANQTEYSLPVTVKRQPPSRVDIQTSNSSPNNNQWEEIYGFEYVPATAGTPAKLILPYQPNAGFSLRVWYDGDHPVLNSYDDIISETIDEELFASMIVAGALEWNNNANSGNDKFLVARENAARDDIYKRRALAPTYSNKRKPKLFYGNQP